MSNLDQTYQAIADHIAENGYPPTVRELGERLGLSSSATVWRRLTDLRDAGRVELAGGPRAIRLKERT